jgi:formylglycine-generating enzyme required for sulfatase activity
MVKVRGGLFTMGASSELQTAALELCREEIGPRNRVACVRDVVDSEGPQRKVYVSPFSIDRVEVTVAAWRVCIQAGACSPAPLALADGRFLRPNLPVTSVTWSEADRYCAWRGARLPTEAEWERAARGTDGRTYPWGAEPECSRANFGNYQGEGRCPKNPGRPTRVGSSQGGAAPTGARDMAGNVWEWVADLYDPRYYGHSPPADPHGPSRGERRVVRGGACCSMFGLPRAANRLAFPPDYRDDDIGFRCAR